MFTIAITGGVGTGKSTAVQMLADFFGPAAVCFNCDAAVHRWLTNPKIVETIAHRFGQAVLDPQGAIDRAALGKQVFASAPDRDFLESLLHPLVLEEGITRWREAQEAKEPAELFIFEVPLLYEVEFAVPRDLDVLIAASPETQQARLREHRGMSEDRAKAVLEAQMPMNEKVKRAGTVVWNDGSLSELAEQITFVTQIIEARKAK